MRCVHDHFFRHVDAKRPGGYLLVLRSANAFAFTLGDRRANGLACKDALR